MPVKVFLRLTSLVIMLIGLTLLAAPSFIEKFFLARPDYGSDIFIRFLGSSLIGYGYLNWFTSALGSIVRMKATLIGNLSTLIIAFFISLFGLISGTLNKNGIFIVLLHLTFGAGFCYYIFKVQNNIEIPKP
jgi:Na+-driven multidrug efflux pump